MASDMNLDLDSSCCLSLPSKEILPNNFKQNSMNAKICAVTKNKILHCSGNSLRVTELDFLSKTMNYSNQNSLFENDMTGDKEEYDTIKWGDCGRGFSCFEYHSKGKRVAHSQRKLNPIINIDSFPNWDSICTLGHGAKVEYAGIAFDLEGNQIAAFGRQQIDGKVWIWKINDDTCNDNSTLHPFVTIELENLCCSCMFNPSNNMQLALLSSDGMCIRINEFSFVLDKVEVHYNDCILSELKKTNQSSNIIKKENVNENPLDTNKNYFKTFVWGSNNLLLVSTKHGSIYIFDGVTGECLNMIPLKNADSLKVHEQQTFVTKILLTRNSIIFGFNDGSVECRHHVSDKNCNIIGSIQKKGSIGSKLLDMSFSPNFDYLFVLSQDGAFHMFDFEYMHKIENEETGAKAKQLEDVKCSKLLGVCISNLFHQSIITGLSPLMLAGKSAYSIMLSGGLDGKVKVWKDSVAPSLQGGNNFPHCIATLDLKSPLTSIVDLNGYPIFCAGTSDGKIVFVHVGRKLGSMNASETSRNVIMTIIKEQKLCLHALTHMKYNSKSRRLAVGSSSLGLVFILNTEPQELKVLGVASTPDSSQLASIAWRNDEPSYLLVGNKTGKLSCYDTSTMIGERKPILPLWAYQLPGVRNLFDFSQSFKLGESKYLFVAHNDCNGIECFEMPEGPINVSKSLIQRVRFVKCGNKGGSFILMSPRAGIMITGSLNGDINLFKCRKNGQLELMSTHHVHNSKVVSIALTGDALRLYSSGMDASSFYFKINDFDGHEILKSSYEFDHLISDTEIDYQRNEQNTHPNLDECWIHQPYTIEEEVDKAKKKKEKIKSDLIDIANKIKKMVEENEHLSVLEQLDRNDFIMDDKKYEVFGSQTQQELNNLQQKFVMRCDQNKMISSRICQRFLDTIDTHHCQILPFTETANASVCNFVIPKLSKMEIREINIAIAIRNTEIKDMQRRSCNSPSLNYVWRSSLDLGNNTSMALNSVSINPLDFCSSILCSENEIVANLLDDGETDELIEIKLDARRSPTMSFLYPLSSIRTKAQRRSQIILLKKLVREIRIDFNLRFETLREEKKKIIQQIKTQHLLMRQIMDQLGHVDEKYRLIEPILDEIEIPESHFHAKKDDLAGQTKVGDEKVLEKNIRYGKKLIEMEMTKDIVFENKTKEVRKNLKEINQSERLKENEMEQTTLPIEEDKKREFLVVKLKKIKSEVISLMKGFDSKVETLSGERFVIKKTILSYELQVKILENGVLLHENLEKENLKLQNDLKEMELEHTSTLHLFKKIQSEHRHFQEKTIKMLDEEKAIEKSFRKDIQLASPIPIDQETVEVLLELYKCRQGFDGKIELPKINNSRIKSERQIKRRSNLSRVSGRGTSSWTEVNHKHFRAGRSISSRGSVDTHQNGLIKSMQLALEEAKAYSSELKESERDPFWQYYKKYHEESSNEIPPLNRNEIPEGFEICDQVWSELEFLRREKILHELKIQQEMDRTKDLKLIQDKIAAKEFKITVDIKYTRSRIEATKNMEKRLLCNPDILLYIKQGQDEVNNDFILADYTSSIIVPQKSIECINKRIREVGSAKMKILLKTKKFRKKINSMKWQSECLTMTENHVNEQYVDWQLLRLSKQLKMVISGTKGESDAEKKARLARQSLKRGEAHEKKVLKLKKENKCYKRSIEEKKKENEKLAMQLKSLIEEVKSREDKYREDEKNVDSKEEKQSRMQQIMKRRNLKDLVKSQQADIDLLKKELERLRLKTFPCFS